MELDTCVYKVQKNVALSELQVVHKSGDNAHEPRSKPERGWKRIPGAHDFPLPRNIVKFKRRFNLMSVSRWQVFPKESETGLSMSRPLAPYYSSSSAFFFSERRWETRVSIFLLTGVSIRFQRPKIVEKLKNQFLRMRNLKNPSHCYWLVISVNAYSSENQDFRETRLIIIRPKLPIIDMQSFSHTLSIQTYELQIALSYLISRSKMMMMMMM